jgi:hypothetical protein
MGESRGGVFEVVEPIPMIGAAPGDLLIVRPESAEYSCVLVKNLPRHVIGNLPSMALVLADTMGVIPTEEVAESDDRLRLVKGSGAA